MMNPFKRFNINLNFGGRDDDPGLESDVWAWRRWQERRRRRWDRRDEGGPPPGRGWRR